MHAQSCQTLCDPMVCSPPDSSVHGILQARILEWVAISFSRGSSQSRDQTQVSCIICIGRKVLYHRATWEALNGLAFPLETEIHKYRASHEKILDSLGM